jgi:hypothetical protein
MTDQEKLKHCFEETIWMALRYANGRSTYAPQMVRDAIKDFQEVYPDWKLRRESGLTERYQLESDCLHDLLPK